MNIDFQTIVNIMVGVFAAGSGWLMREMSVLRKADAELAIEVHKLALVVASLQQYQADTAQFRSEVRETLRYIVERLDRQEGGE